MDPSEEFLTTPRGVTPMAWALVKLFAVCFGAAPVLIIYFVLILMHWLRHDPHDNFD